MKVRQLIVGLLVGASLAVGAPMVAFATEAQDSGKAVQLGVGGISGYSDVSGYDYIYFGLWDGSSVKWRVLDDQTNVGGNGLFLLSDALLGTGKSGDVYFDKEGTSNVWQGSDAQAWCHEFYDQNLSAAEQASVISTTKSDIEYASSGATFGAVDSILNNDKVFFLSAEESESDSYGFDVPDNRTALYNGSSKNWWLRSPSINTEAVTGPTWAGIFVWFLKAPINGNVDGPACARPALNLDSSQVLFSTAATGSGPSEALGILSKVADYSGSEWKLTLLDKTRVFTASTSGDSSVSVPAGGNVEVAYSGSGTGDDEYVSAMLCNADGDVLYYGRIARGSASGSAVVSIPVDLAAGTYTLRVFSEQCNGDKKTDVASAFQGIILNVTPQQEPVPTAAFAATSDTGGVLSNVDSSMKYSVDGGSTWNGVTGTSMEISGVTADKDVWVYRQGNGSTTSNSAIQKIDITQASQPTTASGEACTSILQNDGKITGVDATMEYRIATAVEWTAIIGSEVSNLNDGTYHVRVAANGAMLASPYVEVTVEAHVCSAHGAWQYDESNHWKQCSCGAKVYEGAHLGGAATCSDLAVCDACRGAYGELNPYNHSSLMRVGPTPATHMTEGNIEYWRCSDCGGCFGDAAGSASIDPADTVIPKLSEHVADGTGWHFDENVHWNVCICEEAINMGPHAFGGWMSNGDGTHTGTCSCGKTSVEVCTFGDGNTCKKCSYERVHIVKQPADISVVPGADASFSVVVQGTQAQECAYQWQVIKDGGQSWEDVEGATSSKLTVPDITIGMNGWQYLCVITLPDNTNIDSRDAAESDPMTLKSDAATLTVRKPPEPVDPGPSVPEDPEDPEDPDVPENPDVPEDPEEPETPVEPEDPATPEDPEDPDAPVDPDDPGVPEDPENPSNPGEPEDPGNPENPEQPSTGDEQVGQQTNAGQQPGGGPADNVVIPQTGDATPAGGAVALCGLGVTCVAAAAIVRRRSAGE